MSWMIYGANGYTGRITAELAVKRGLKPVLAGRNGEAIRAIADPLGLPYRIVSLDDSAGLREALADIKVVLHTAGPFSATSKPMVDACIDTGAHYLDITGEIDVFEACFARGAEAKAAGIALLPGVGFDVVPTDCLAKMVADKLDDVTHLEIAFAGSSAMSPGTTKTSIEGLGEPSRARIDGEIRDVPNLWKVREIPFTHKARSAGSIPWGDVSTAFYSTGVPNIVTYMAMPKAMQRGVKIADHLRPVLRIGAVQRTLKKLVEWTVTGPDEGERSTSYSDVWVEARSSDGRIATGTLTAPAGYSLTADASIRAVVHMLEDSAPTGALTPSLAFGGTFVLECDDVEMGPIVFS